MFTSRLSGNNSPQVGRRYAASARTVADYIGVLLKNQHRLATCEDESLRFELAKAISDELVKRLNAYMGPNGYNGPRMRALLQHLPVTINLAAIERRKMPASISKEVAEALLQPYKTRRATTAVLSDLTSVDMMEITRSAHARGQASAPNAAILGKRAKDGSDAKATKGAAWSGSAGQLIATVLAARHAADLRPNDAGVQATFGNLLAHLGLHRQALLPRQRAVRLAPNWAPYRRSLDMTLGNLYRYSEGLQHSEKAAALAPNNASYQYYHGLGLGLCDRHTEALPFLQQAAHLDPACEKYQTTLARVLAKLERNEAAAVHRQKAVQLAPRQSFTRYMLSINLLELKRYDEALMHMREVVRQEPKHAIYQFTLGTTLYDLRRYSEALVHQRAALKLRPNSAYYATHVRWAWLRTFVLGSIFARQ